MKQLYIFRYTTTDNKTKKKPVLAYSFNRAIKHFYRKPERADVVLHSVDLAIDGLSQKIVKHFQS
jgi:aspartyl/asparaginyl-tRNA synthetase